MKIIEMQEIHEINTDPMRRCYNGCHFSSELVRGPWKTLEYVENERAQERLKFWQELNAYAVSERGFSAKTYYRVVDDENR